MYLRTIVGMTSMLNKQIYELVSSVIVEHYLNGIYFSCSYILSTNSRIITNNIITLKRIKMLKLKMYLYYLSSFIPLFLRLATYSILYP